MSGDGSRRVVLLGTDCSATRMVYHVLKRETPDLHVVLEEPVSRAQLLRRRIKRLGIVEAAGQLLFIALAAPLLQRAGAARREEIRREFGLDDSPIDAAVIHVPSVNSPEARETLRSIAPRLVIVSGTRIIGRETLQAIDAPFINMHAGITPLYRGAHGGYWALAEGNPHLVGTTVHLVDPGIDTGSVLGQATFTVTPADTFATYPYLHTAAGLPLLVAALRGALAGTLQPRQDGNPLPSRLRFHPTLCGYLSSRIRRAVR